MRDIMAERLVDVLNNSKLVLHIYVVEVEERVAFKNDAAFSDKALMAPVFDQLMPDPSSLPGNPDACQPRETSGSVRG
jgi:hypothetical protein